MRLFARMSVQITRIGVKTTRMSVQLVSYLHSPCIDHTRACRNHTLECHIYTMRVVFTLCV
jgi:hypothetical protein